MLIGKKLMVEKGFHIQQVMWIEKCTTIARTHVSVSDLSGGIRVANPARRDYAK